MQVTPYDFYQFPNCKFGLFLVRTYDIVHVNKQNQALFITSPCKLPRGLRKSSVFRDNLRIFFQPCYVTIVILQSPWDLITSFFIGIQLSRDCRWISFPYCELAKAVEVAALKRNVTFFCTGSGAADKSFQIESYKVILLIFR